MGPGEMLLGPLLFVVAFMLWQVQGRTRFARAHTHALLAPTAPTPRPLLRPTFIPSKVLGGNTRPRRTARPLTYHPGIV